MKSSSILSKYGKKLMVNRDELKKYSKDHNEMFVIEFENFEKFNKPVKPERFVTVAGKYIDNNEYDLIKSNKD